MSDPLYDPLRAAVRERLSAVGMTQAELCRRVGISPVTLSRWISPGGSRATLHPATLAKILRALNLEITINQVKS